MTTSVQPALTPILQFFDNRGVPNAGGSVLTQVGSVNHATWQDSAGSTPLPNPIPLNSRGEVSNSSGVSCQLFLESGVTYTFTQYDAAGNQLNQATAEMGAGSQFTGSGGSALIGFIQTGSGAVARTVQAKERDTISVTDFGVNLVPGTTDMTAAFNAWTAAIQALGDYQGGEAPPGTYLVTDTVNLPNTNGWCLKMYGVKIIFTPSVAGKDCFASSNVWAGSSNDVQFLGKPLIYTASANARYGINWTALNRSRVQAHCQGFSATNSAGFFTNDAIIVDADLELDYNYYGLLQDATHTNAPMNAWSLKLRVENNTQVAARVYEANGLDVAVVVSESNGAGIDVRKGAGISIGSEIGGYLGEGNALYDVQLGVDGYVYGAHVAGTANSVSTLAGTQTPHPVVVLYSVDGFTHNLQINNGTWAFQFALAGGVRNSFFGPLAWSASASGGDPTQAPPVNNPPGPLYDGCTYSGLAADPGFLSRNNIIADYSTYPCSGSNLLQYDMPLGEIVLGGTGTPTWTRSPNTGTVADRIYGRPVGLLDIGAAPSGTNLSATVPVPVNQGLVNQMFTFAVDVQCSSTPVITMTLDDGAGGSTTSVSYTLAANLQTIYVSGYINSLSNVRAVLDGFTTSGAYKFANPRIFTGMDPRTCPRLTGKPQFLGAKPTAGTFEQADVVWRSSATASQTPGYVCTTAGTGGGVLVFGDMANLA